MGSKKLDQWEMQRLAGSPQEKLTAGTQGHEGLEAGCLAISFLWSIPHLLLKRNTAGTPKNVGVEDEFPFSKVMRFPGFMLAFGDVATRASCGAFCASITLGMLSKFNMQRESSKLNQPEF